MRIQYRGLFQATEPHAAGWEVSPFLYLTGTFMGQWHTELCKQSLCVWQVEPDTSRSGSFRTSATNWGVVTIERPNAKHYLPICDTGNTCVCVSCLTLHHQVKTSCQDRPRLNNTWPSCLCPATSSHSLTVVWTTHRRAELENESQKVLNLGS